MPNSTSAPATSSITLLLPRLSGWISQLVDDSRYPALEWLLARATAQAALDNQLDPLRLKLFNRAIDGEIPVAALGLLASGSIPVSDHSYHLRLDPVTMQADISRVVMMRSGFGGFPGKYCSEVQEIVRQVLADEGLQLQAATGSDGGGGVGTAAVDHWTLTLPENPGVRFTALDDALGADISECLPEGEAGRRWKRLANEIQMALHASHANEHRRQHGEPLVNGVWFWGGGRLPAMPPAKTFDRVFSNDPVSCGLAKLQQVDVYPLEELLCRRGFSPDKPGSGLTPLRQGNILIDWAIPASSSANEETQLTPDTLDAFCAEALAWLKQQGGSLDFHTPEFSCLMRSRDRLRFWRRPKLLAQQLQALIGKSEATG
ncbi:MAG TPA: hypothetical protein VFG52_10100 [Xanthomonadales bacterium]|nr:hypothetical protein [Xanthomonadales bacterium]